MNMIDVRITNESQDLEKLIGSELIKYTHDPLVYSNSVFGVVGLYLSDSNYAITNFTEKMDYYGDEEDVAIFKLENKGSDVICSAVENVKMIDIPVSQIISKVMIVNEHQKLFKDDKQIYDVKLTRGLIFELEDGLQLSFEKNVWFFEDITVTKGYDLIKSFSPVEEFIDGWEELYSAECNREVITLNAGK